jgi:hypothetical protein
MRIRTTIVLAIVAASGGLWGLSAETPPLPHWSAVKVQVVEDATGKPVPGALIEQLCRVCVYASDRPVTDTNGVARVMIFEQWVLLKTTKDGVTNSLSLFRTNEVQAFRTNAIIRLKK